MSNESGDPNAHDFAKQPHYAHGIEPIEFMRSRFLPDEFRGFLRGNCIKYLSRYTDKGGVEDLRKARVYLDWLIQHHCEDAGLGGLAPLRWADLGDV